MKYTHQVGLSTTEVTLWFIKQWRGGQNSFSFHGTIFTLKVQGCREVITS